MKQNLETTIAERCAVIGITLDKLKKKAGKSLTPENLNKYLGLGVNFWRSAARG